MSTNRLVSVLVACAFAATGVIEHSEAQTIRRITYPSFDEPNNKPNFGSWSQTCGGSRTDLASSNDTYQCVREVDVLTSPSQTRFELEHIWRFTDVPPGVQFLAFEGHAPAGEVFEFRFNTNQSYTQFQGISDGPAYIDTSSDRTCGAGSSCPPPILGFMLPLHLTTTAASTEIWVLVWDKKRGGCPDDASQDSLYVDYLAIVTRPSYGNPEAACADTIDNDGDLSVDCYDTDCQLACEQEMICDNCINDDYNSDSLTDCADISDCESSPTCGY